MLEEAEINNQSLSVEIVPGAALKDLNAIEVTTESRRVLVLKFIQILDEVAHSIHPAESRDKGILAKHHHSELIRWLEASTKLFQIIPGELFHYSVETAEDFYHVITREHPSVQEVVVEV